MQRLMKNIRTGRVAVFDQACVDSGAWVEQTEPQTDVKSASERRIVANAKTKILFTSELKAPPKEEAEQQ